MEKLPPALDPAAWKPDDLARSEAWRRTFTGRELAELLAVARTTMEPKSRRSRLLARSRARDRKTANELKLGLGFRILRGLPVKELGKEGVARVFMALSRRLGRPMDQPGGVKLARVRAEPQGKGKGRYGFRGHRRASLPRRP